MSMNSQDVINVLRAVIHPEKNTNIVDLEMIKDINIHNGTISFTLHFKSFNDPFKSSLKQTCIDSLKYEFGKETEININVYTDVKPVSKKKDNGLMPGVKHIIAVASGKGGVGKSTVAVNLAVTFAKRGYSVGLIDADIFGPSIPLMMNVMDARPTGEHRDGKDMIVPLTNFGVKMLSIGFFVSQEEAVVWRGPMASNAFKQLMSDAVWEDIDFMFVDLPPGTSDIHITLSQSVPVTGAIIVSTPQKVALADAIKGIKMFTGDKINVPILGLIENMAWFTPRELPDNKYYIFGKNGCRRLAAEMNVPFLGEVPIVQSICEDADNGKPSALFNPVISEVFDSISDKIIENINKPGQ